MGTSWVDGGAGFRGGRQRAPRWLQSRTEGPGWLGKNLGAVAVLATALVTGTENVPWPPFLPARDAFAPDVVADVEHVWADPTLSRTVRGRPATVPFDVYVAFVDTPDVTTAAARFLGLARYRVIRLGADWYEADDDDGAQGTYRVLARSPARRVMLSWGEHRGSILGEIGGSALTVIDLEPRDGRVDQELAAYVRIDNGFAAALARLLIPIFGYLADRKLAQGLAVTAKVAEWAVGHPAEFCAWLEREPLPPERRRPFVETLPACR